MELNLGALGIWSLSDVAIVVGFIGLIAYYFGKVVSENKTLKEVREVNYAEGFLFLFYYVFSPYAIYTLFEMKLNSNVLTIILFVLQISFLLWLFPSWKISRDRMLIEGNLLKNKLGNGWLYVLNFLNLLLSLIILRQEISLIYKGLSIILFALSLNYVAMLHGSLNSNTIEVTIHFNSNSQKRTLVGKLLKIEDEVINVLSEGKIYHIFSNNILMVEHASKEEKK